MGEIVSFNQNAAFFSERGKKALRDRDFLTAVPLLNKALSMEPDNVDYRTDLALCYIEMRQPGEARDLMEEYIGACDEVTPAAYMTYAHCFVVDGDFRLAVEILRNIKDEDISEALPDTDDEDDDLFNVGYGPDITLADDSEAVNERLRSFVENGDLKGAREFLSTIDRQSANYPEALKAVGMIYMHQRKPRKAKPYFEETLVYAPLDIYTLTSLVMIEDSPRQKPVYMKALLRCEPGDSNDVARICRAMRAAGLTQEALRCMEKLYKDFPYDKEVIVTLVKYYADFGACDRARELSMIGKKLFPRDLVLAELNRSVSELSGAGALPLEDGLGAEETYRRLDELEGWLERKSSVSAAVKGMKENPKIAEYVYWLFQTEIFSVQANVGCFLAQSPKWQPFIRAQLLKDTPEGLKYEFIRTLLMYAPDKRFRVIVDDVYSEFEPALPVKTDESMADVYWTAFAGLCVTQDDFESKLDKAFISLARAYHGETLKNFDDPACIAAALVYKSRFRKPYLGKREIEDLFSITDDELIKYTEIYFKPVKKEK